MRKLIAAALFALFASLWSVPDVAAQVVKLCAEGGSGGSSCATTIQPQATASAVESSHVFKSSGPSTAVDFQVNNTSAGVLWVMLFDAATPPTGAGAAVTGCSNAASARPCVAKWYQIGANSTIGVSWSSGPFVQLQTGQVVVCSSTGPFTLTYSVNCTFSGEAM